MGKIVKSLEAIEARLSDLFRLCGEIVLLLREVLAKQEIDAKK